MLRLNLTETKIGRVCVCVWGGGGGGECVCACVCVCVGGGVSGCKTDCVAVRINISVFSFFFTSLLLLLLVFLSQLLELGLRVASSLFPPGHLLYRVLAGYVCCVHTTSFSALIGLCNRLAVLKKGPSSKTHHGSVDSNEI